MSEDTKENDVGNEATQKKFQEFEDTFKAQGKQLVKWVFPQKVIELEAIHKSLALGKLGEIHSDLPVPDAVVLNGNGPDEPANTKERHKVQGTEMCSVRHETVPTNARNVKICEKLKPFIHDLIDHSNTINLWIIFLIPKIEDGDNCGVEIQEKVKEEAAQMENSAKNYLDSITTFFNVRGKLVSKVTKYPHIEDYRQAIKDYDENTYASLRLICAQLRNQYAPPGISRSFPTGDGKDWDI